MSFAAGAFSGGARGAGGQSGGGPSRKVPTSTQQDAKDKRTKDGLQGIEENNENANTNTPRATASLMFHALTSGLGVLGKEGPDKK